MSTEEIIALLEKLYDAGAEAGWQACIAVEDVDPNDRAKWVQRIAEALAA